VYQGGYKVNCKRKPGQRGAGTREGPTGPCLAVSNRPPPGLHHNVFQLVRTINGFWSRLSRPVRLFTPGFGLSRSALPLVLPSLSSFEYFFVNFSSEYSPEQTIVREHYQNYSHQVINVARTPSFISLSLTT